MANLGRSILLSLRYRLHLPSAMRDKPIKATLLAPLSNSRSRKSFSVTLLMPETSSFRPQSPTHSVWAFGIEQAILGLLTKTESMTAKCLLVEVNTVILTIQKMFRIRSLQPLMLATWGFYRLLWYPYLTYQVCYYLAPSTSRFSFAVWIQTMICCKFSVFHSMHYSSILLWK